MPKWGETINGVRYYPLHQGQFDVINSTAKITAAFSGTGGGKTCVLPLWMARRIYEAPNGKFLIVVPWLSVFQTSDLLRFMQTAYEDTPLQGKWNNQAKTYTCNCGATIYIKTADNAEAIEGGSYNACAIDEIAKILDPKVWHYVLARVGHRNGKILTVGTPDVDSWIVDAIVEPFLRGDKDYYVRHWGTLDNPTYPREVVEQARKVMSPANFERRYGGIFAAREGLIYPDFPKRILKLPVELPSPAIKVMGGIDWGWSDELSAHIGILCQDGNIYVVEELYGSKIDIDVLKVKLKEMEHKWSIDFKTAEGYGGGGWDGWICDASRPELISHFRKYNISARSKLIKLVEHGIQLVDQRLRAGMLYIYESCPNLIREAKNYAYRQNKNGSFEEKPIDGRDHACDSLRYLIGGFDFGRQVNYHTNAPRVEMQPDIKPVVEKLKLTKIPEPVYDARAAFERMMMADSD